MKNLSLNQNLFSSRIKTFPVRDGFGKGVLQAGKKDKRLVVLSADLKESTRTKAFAQKYPHRYIEVGVAEQALATVAAGMALYGKIPFISSFAVFSPGRNWEQIRTTICLNRLPVKIAGSHAGLTVGPDGATHQATEDIALMRALPHMTIIAPCDAHQAQKATLAAAKTSGPIYLRLSRPPTPAITTTKTPFKIGKAQVFYPQDYHPSQKHDVALIACGPQVYDTLLAARQLKKENIKPLVINNHTIKPLDKTTLIAAAHATGAIVTIEDHQIHGGLGSSIAELLAKFHPLPIEFVAISDSFGQSGTPDQLLEKYHLTATDIVKAAQKAIKRKTS